MNLKEEQLYKEKNINTITAVNNTKILNEIKKINKIKIINSDIQYKEGIIEILEKDKNVDLIFLNESLIGNISLINLIKKIRTINNKIKIIIFILNINEKNQKIINQNNITYIKIKKTNSKTINEKIKILNKKQKNKTIRIFGNRGSGKTFFSIIITELLIKKFGKKVLIIDGDEWSNSITKIYLPNKGIKSFNLINKNLSIINIKECKEEKININNKIKTLKEKYDYLLFDFNKENFFKKANIEIFIIENNLLELNKIINKIKNKNNIKIILNKYNKNALSKNILEKTLNLRSKIEKIDFISNINLIIDNKVNINFLNKREKRKFISIIKNEILL